MGTDSVNVIVNSAQDEVAAKRSLSRHLRGTAIPDDELLDNIGLYVTRQTLSRFMFMQHIYEKIVPVHGIIVEFGVRWGQNLALFSALRGIHEPFNHNRKIVGFDTFDGFPSVSAEDGSRCHVGDYNVSEGWKDHLESILDFHNKNAPIAHRKKYELVVGDALVTVPEYLKQHPETIVALAYFDFDIYAPTRAALEAIRPHLTKGSVLAFDELNLPEFPGETLALREVLGLDRHAIRRVPYSPTTSYIVIE